MNESASVLCTVYRSEDTYLHVWGHHYGRPNTTRARRVLKLYSYISKLVNTPHVRLYRKITGSLHTLQPGLYCRVVHASQRGPPRVLETGEDFSAGISLAVPAGVAGTASVEAWKQASPPQGGQKPPL